VPWWHHKMWDMKWHHLMSTLAFSCIFCPDLRGWLLISWKCGAEKLKCNRKNSTRLELSRVFAAC
jgi:hypothetical protein